MPCDRLRLLDLESGGYSDLEGLWDRHVIALTARPDGEAVAVISWAEPLDDPGAFTARLHVVDTPTGKVEDLGAIGLDVCTPVWWRDSDARWHNMYIATPPDAASTRPPCASTGFCEPTSTEAGASASSIRPRTVSWSTPGEGHGIMERAHRLDVMRRSLAWFDRWLSPTGEVEGAANHLPCSRKNP